MCGLFVSLHSGCPMLPCGVCAVYPALAYVGPGGTKAHPTCALCVPRTPIAPVTTRCENCPKVFPLKSIGGRNDSYTFKRGKKQGGVIYTIPVVFKPLSSDSTSFMQEAMFTLLASYITTADRTGQSVPVGLRVYSVMAAPNPDGVTTNVGISMEGVPWTGKPF